MPFNKTTKLIPEERRNQRITPDMRHDHLEGWRPREIAAFFNSIFKNGIPLPKITSIEKQDTVIIFKFVSTTTIKRADFYYSNDTISINAERIWKNVPASVLDNKIICSLPKEGFKFGFLYATDIMDLGVSSELIIN